MAGLDPDEQLYHDLLEIQRAAERSAAITKQLLAFARRQLIVPEVIDLNEGVGNILKMLGRLIGEDIELLWLPSAEVWPVKMDPTQLDQLLANLCVNARDAIAGQGKITIETKNATLDEEYCAEHHGAVPGDFALLLVSDDGCGMDPKTLEHVFEPFFTTKEVGEGTGLGLATVYGIVKQNGGFINAYSEPGQGTTFKIYLPRHLGEGESKVTAAQAALPRGRGEMVLLVEDEEAILAMAGKMLSKLGYRVLSADRPGRALEMAAAHVGMIDLLLTDVVMPELNGRELAEQLRARRSGLKVLYMSGYTANVIAHRGVLDEGMNFIAKPFSEQELATRVRRALDEAAP